jgi:hypothetical protein
MHERLLLTTTILGGDAVTAASLQHQRCKVSVQDRILHGVEHNLDVLRIDGSREVMIDWLRRLQTLVVTVVAADTEKHLQDEGLNVDDRVRVAGVLRIVPAYVSLGVLHFLR